MRQIFQDIGMAMHHAASRFARTTQEAAATNGLPRAFGAPAVFTQQCVTGHAGYRLR